MAPSKFIAVLLGLAAVSLTVAQVPPPPPPSATPPAPSSENGSTCDPLRLAVCGNLLSALLGGLLPGIAGNGTSGSQCCPLLGGLVGLDAAVCLCIALRANVLGIVNLNVPLALRLLLNTCGGAVPAGFTCAPA